MAETEESLSAEGMGFILALQAQSQRNLAYTQNSLHASALDDAIAYGELILEMDDILADAMVVDRMTEHKLRRLGGRIALVEQHLDHLRSMRASYDRPMED